MPIKFLGGFILGVCAFIALMFWENSTDNYNWHNGVCRNCGSSYEITNIEKARSGQTYYYYSCKDCGYTIKTYRNFTKTVDNE